MRQPMAPHLPAIMRFLSVLAILIYGVYEAATWSNGGPASLRGPMLHVITIGIVLGWVPLLTENRVRAVVREENDRLLQELNDRDDSRADEDRRQALSHAAADQLLQQRIPGNGALRRINGH